MHSNVLIWIWHNNVIYGRISTLKCITIAEFFYITIYTQAFTIFMHIWNCITRFGFYSSATLWDIKCIASWYFLFLFSMYKSLAKTWYPVYTILYYIMYIYIYIYKESCWLYILISITLLPLYVPLNQKKKKKTFMTI